MTGTGKKRQRQPYGNVVRRAPWLAIGWLTLLLAAPVVADLVTPPVPPEPAVVPLTLAGLVDLVVRTMIERGVVWILFGSAAVVGVPWAIAGLADPSP